MHFRHNLPISHGPWHHIFFTKWSNFSHVSDKALPFSVRKLWKSRQLLIFIISLYFAQCENDFRLKCENTKPKTFVSNLVPAFTRRKYRLLGEFSAFVARVKKISCFCPFKAAGKTPRHGGQLQTAATAVRRSEGRWRRRHVWGLHIHGEHGQEGVESTKVTAVDMLWI